ncbi:MAG: hypothetical protein Q7T50_06235, partial [Candidatus Magasanikbacteria bacterium]|nr:hypothetical protein [Candidatus Magasanikbacteria bacterium]
MSREFIKLKVESFLRIFMKRKILLGLTTTSQSDWRAKVKEIDEFNIREIALFPTCLKIEERKELYKLLESTKLESIPHVHLRGEDMEEWELDFLVNRYGTKFFNIHPNIEDSEVLGFVKYCEMIYVENLHDAGDVFLQSLKKCAGICFDTSHYEDYGAIQKIHDYDNFLEILKQNKVGCCHISAVVTEPLEDTDYISGDKTQSYSRH